MCETVDSPFPPESPDEEARRRSRRRRNATAVREEEERQERPPHRPVELRIRLDINPEDREDRNRHGNDRFVLTGPDGYRQEKTIEDDSIPGDEWLDLHYTGLFEDWSYTLQIIPENGPPYSPFENSPYPEIIRMSPSLGQAASRQDPGGSSE